MKKNVYKLTPPLLRLLRKGSLLQTILGLLLHKRVQSLILSFSLCGSVFCQTPDGRDTNYGLLQNYQTPEVATFNTYGNIPVSLYTGTPTISIPVYTLKDQGIEIPIRLSYNINNVKPNVRPGIVGLGWNLFAGGNVTRIQEGDLPDELPEGFFHHNRRLSDNWFDDYCMNIINDCTPYNHIAGEPWYSKEKLHLDAKLFRQGSENPWPNKQRDISPDKFIFNFLGYSGSFYRNEYNQWIVDSETPFKIDHQMIAYKDSKDMIKKGINVLVNISDVSEQTFENFTLTSPDGVVFEFGGKNAIDYSTVFFNRLFSTGNQVFPTATTWHLSKIKLLNGSEIRFDYIDSAPNLEGNFTVWIQSNYEHNYYGRNLNFQIVLPVLLDKITTSDSTSVKFKYKESSQLEYKNGYFGDFGSNLDLDLNRDNQKAIVDPEFGFKPVYVDNLNEFKWSQLDEIVLPDKTFYKLDYSNSKQERLKLNSLTKTETTGKLKETHRFYYNELKLPDYISGFYDHLGFYNGKDFSFVFKPSFYFKMYGDKILELNPNAIKEMKDNASLFYSRRNGDPTGYYTQAEMLQKIEYPTGGYSSFYYEPHTVEGIVSEDRQSVVPCSPKTALSTPGGLRISKIRNFSNDGKFVNERMYSYQSGILAFTPKYFWDLTILREYPTNDAAYIPSLYNDSVKILTSGSTNQAYFNMEGSAFVGYSEVTEYNLDSNGKSEGYTKYKYTNFSDGYFDEKPLENINDPTGKSTVISPYTPFVSHSKKRGQLKSQEIYDNQFKLKQGSYYKYNATQEIQVRAENLFSLRNEHEKVNGYFEQYSGIYSFGGTYLRKIYECLMSEKVEKTIIGSDTVVKRFNYEYNKENKQVKERLILSPTEEREVLSVFTGDLFRKSDYTKCLRYNYMENNNMYTLPLETVVLKNGNIVSSEVIDYSALYPGNIIPHKIYKYESSQPIPFSSYQPARIIGDSLQIDPKNELTQTNYSYYEYPVLDYVETKTGRTVYVWGYNEKYPIAKIENSTLDEVVKSMGYPTIPYHFNLEFRNRQELTQEQWAKVNNLRNLLPNSSVTTYTYKPYWGMTSSTDPRGFTTYYDYDGLGRLKRIYIKEGNGKKTIENYDNHYANQ